MPAGLYNFVAEQYADFARVLLFAQDTQGTPVDLTGCYAAMDVRQSPGDPLMIHMSTDNGLITLGGATGLVTLGIPAATMAGLVANSELFAVKATVESFPPDPDVTGTGWQATYDFLLKDASGRIIRTMAGVFCIVPGTTQVVP